MPELTFRSAGVSTREIDLTGGAAKTPVGIPAGVIGTSDKGPAFVPVTLGSMGDFSRKFGPTDGEKFGPLAVNSWLKNAQSIAYVRVLGAGDGKKRNDDGTVTNAGFVVGQQLVQANGVVGKNKSAYNSAGAAPLGRTYFLGCCMSQSAGSTVFTAAGVVDDGTNVAHPILRGVLLAPSGVVLKLSGNFQADNTPTDTTVGNADTAAGAITGTVDISSAKQQFVMLMVGHLDNPEENAPNVLSASFDLEAPNYISRVFNTDPNQIEKKGHYLYSHYDIHPSLAVVTGAGITSYSPIPGHAQTQQDIAILTTGTLPRNTANSSGSPDYEGFLDRFRTPLSPYVISQEFGGSPYDIFKVHALSDGAYDTTRIKISIENLNKSNSDVNKFGTFDLVVRSFSDTDDVPIVLEEFRGLSLDANADRFFARVVGDQRAYFDFDKAPDSQRLVVEGDYPNLSQYVRVQQSTALKASNVPDEALPVGFRGPYHLVTSGTQTLANIKSGTLGGVTPNYLQSGWSGTGSYGLANRMTELPIPFRENLAIGLAPKKIVKPTLYWGCQFMRKVSLTEKNKVGLPDPTFNSYAKYFPKMQVTNTNFSVGDNVGTADSNGIVFDSDKFNNNKFTLENLKVRTGSDTYADPDQWVSASYRRNGKISTSAGNKTRRWKVDDLKNVGNKRFTKFTFFLQGGFDGVNIFDKDKANLSDNAAKREMDDSSNQGGNQGPTVAAYRKAIDVMGNTSDVDIKLLAIPGLRETSVTNYAISAVESRFDAMYIMDIEERDVSNNVVTSSVQQNIDVGYTVTDFKNRGLDTSFAAAYFPDVILQDPTRLTNVRCPPSVAVLGAFSLNDTLGHPWFAPAGFSRGALKGSLYTAVDLNRSNLDGLYDADINPITDFSGTGLVVWGQKTLQQAASALDRVNVRRLLIEIRRSVRAVANTILFEPNREETLAKFSSLVNPILQSIQERSGVDRYKVVIDTTTTTQADVENNTIRGKIYLQPTRTAEFIALDFVVTNAGAEI